MTTITAEVTFAEAVTTGAGAVEAARAILRRAKDCPRPVDPGAREAREDAVWKVADALAIYGRLQTGIIRPEDEIPGLEPGPEAFGRALGAIAEDVSRDAAVLADVIERHCGDEAGAKARGEGEQS